MLQSKRSPSCLFARMCLNSARWGFALIYACVCVCGAREKEAPPSRAERRCITVLHSFTGTEVQTQSPPCQQSSPRLDHCVFFSTVCVCVCDCDVLRWSIFSREITPGLIFQRKQRALGFMCCSCAVHIISWSSF